MVKSVEKKRNAADKFAVKYKTERILARLTIKLFWGY
jgi:hypothetical protein